MFWQQTMKNVHFCEMVYGFVFGGYCKRDKCKSVTHYAIVGWSSDTNEYENGSGCWELVWLLPKEWFDKMWQNEGIASNYFMLVRINLTKLSPVNFNWMHKWHLEK